MLKVFAKIAEKERTQALVIKDETTNNQQSIII
jgi:hypothetical protein